MDGEAVLTHGSFIVHCARVFGAWEGDGTNGLSGLGSAFLGKCRWGLVLLSELVV